MSSNLIQQPYTVMLDPNGGGGKAKPIAQGYFWYGEIDKDPKVSPINVFYKDESGAEVQLIQPLRTNSSGAFVDPGTGKLIQPYTKLIGYSVLIMDKNQSKVIYSDLNVGDPGNVTSLVISGDSQVIGGVIFPSSPLSETQAGGEPQNATFFRIKHWADIHLYVSPKKLTGTIDSVVSNGDTAVITIGGVANTVYKYTSIDLPSDKSAKLSSLTSGMTLTTKGVDRLGDRGENTYIVKTPSDYKGKTSDFGDLLLANSNIAQQLSIKPEPRDVRLFAHRGGMRDVCEATPIAWQNSLESGAYGLTTELGCSSDGVWFVYHGANLSRLTNGTGNIYDQTAAYIEGLSFTALAGTRYETTVKIPRLDDLIHFIEKTGTVITCEIANARPASVDSDKQAAIDKFAASPARKNVFLEVTGNADADRIRSTSTELSMSWSFASNWANPSELYGVAEYRNMRIRVPSNWVDTPIAQEAISTARALDLDIFCYTTENSAEDIEKVLAAGIYNIITDRGWE